MLRNKYSKALGLRIKWSEPLADGTRRLTFADPYPPGIAKAFGSLLALNAAEILTEAGLHFKKVTFHTNTICGFRNYLRVYHD